MLKERLCFDPEFWNLLTLRTYCLELMSDHVMKAAVLSEMKEEEEEAYNEELLINKCVDDSCTHGFNSCRCTEAAFENHELPEERTVDGERGKCVAPLNNALLKRRKWRKSLRRVNKAASDDEADPDPGDDPEFKYNLKPTFSSNKPVYALRRNHSSMESSASVKIPLGKREYLSRCVKSQILKRAGQKKRWLQGLPRLEPVQTVKEKKVKYKGKKRGRKPLQKLELSYPDNVITLTEEESGFEEITDSEEKELDMPHLENELEQKTEENRLEQMDHLERENGPEEHPDLVCGSSLNEQTHKESQPQSSEGLPVEPQAAVPAVEADPELDGPLLELLDCPILLHNYSLNSRKPDGEKPLPSESTAPDEVNGDTEQEPQSTVETEVSNTEVSCL